MKHITMRLLLVLFLNCISTLAGWAQLGKSVHFAEESFRDMGQFEAVAKRQAVFGQTIPQEKVYIHMDNTCYTIGDTIWFSAYIRQTTDDRPSCVSGVLYVELLNHDGYLVERKLIEMKEGRGHGNFSLNQSVLYAGFYELRAYTRWQLNWGRFE